MCSIGIVGDLHIAPTPSNRMDDYFNTGIRKINEISQYCEHVVFLGDIFTNAKVDEQYTNFLITTLRKNINNGNKYYTIIGNHDVQNELEDRLLNSSLGTLYVAQVMNIITPDNPIVIDCGNKKYRFNTTYVNFATAKSHLQNLRLGEDAIEDILLIHHQYDAGSLSFHQSDLEPICGPNCKKIFFGHDHCPLPQGRIIYPNFAVYRSGSIMRNKADDYNLTRQLYYYVLTEDNLTCQAVSTQPASEVFTMQSYTRENYQKKQFVKSVDSLVEKYTNNISTQSKFSIKTILEELNTPVECMDYLQKKHTKIGEVLK